MNRMNKAGNVIKSALKTAVYFLDQTDRVASDVRDRVSDTVDQAADRVSDLHDRARNLYAPDHTLRNILMFTAGVGVGVAAGMLLAPASGDEIRDAIGDKVHDIGDRVRDRFSAVSRATTNRAATGTEAL
jgi:gas vesicle protein